ncbi:hypothetical protein F2Q68_00001257 [Brassica cretica]|uniref:Uncharacterized protein n=1 Tax=Brassica cretica TaxID=69181 RepID=A0A8S9JL39_BRACR|nr:hypothetical protein F2Q68_00001257 [Brassica cretica]
MMFESPSKKRWKLLSSSSSYRETIVLGRRYSKSCREQKQQGRRSTEERLLPKWKVLLRKLKLLPSPRFTKVTAYELDDYSLNFDQGPGWHDHDEPENLARSFSSRFADPTKNIRATRLLLY